MKKPGCFFEFAIRLVGKRIFSVFEGNGDFGILHSQANVAIDV